jgi:hypothetical protein
VKAAARIVHESIDGAESLGDGRDKVARCLLFAHIGAGGQHFAATIRNALRNDVEFIVAPIADTDAGTAGREEFRARSADPTRRTRDDHGAPGEVQRRDRPGA